jgi:hypothetical protein
MIHPHQLIKLFSIKLSNELKMDETLINLLRALVVKYSSPVFNHEKLIPALIVIWTDEELSHDYKLQIHNTIIEQITKSFGIKLEVQYLVLKPENPEYESKADRFLSEVSHCIEIVSHHDGVVLEFSDIYFQNYKRMAKGVVFVSVNEENHYIKAWYHDMLSFVEIFP